MAANPHFRMRKYDRGTTYNFSGGGGVIRSKAADSPMNTMTLTKKRIAYECDQQNTQHQTTLDEKSPKEGDASSDKMKSLVVQTSPVTNKELSWSKVVSDGESVSKKPKSDDPSNPFRMKARLIAKGKQAVDEFSRVTGLKFSTSGSCASVFLGTHKRLGVTALKTDPDYGSRAIITTTATGTEKMSQLSIASILVTELLSKGARSAWFKILNEDSLASNSVWYFVISTRTHMLFMIHTGSFVNDSDASTLDGDMSHCSITCDLYCNI